MSHFEYISIAISIILGLGVIQLLSNLDDILDRRRRHWLHMMWTFFLFWMMVQNWWAFWDLRVVEWNIAYFTSWIAYVSIIYVLVITLVKPASPDALWIDHYFQNHRRFFSLLVAAGVLAILQTWIMLGASLLHPYRFVQYALMIIAIVLSATSNPKAHSVLGPVSMAFLLGSQFLFRFTPGLFGGSS